jgi:hypothetical protein
MINPYSSYTILKGVAKLLFLLPLGLGVKKNRSFAQLAEENQSLPPAGGLG